MTEEPIELMRSQFVIADEEGGGGMVKAKLWRGSGSILTSVRLLRPLMSLTPSRPD